MGTLGSDKGDVHENVAENRLRILFKFFTVITNRSVT